MTKMKSAPIDMIASAIDTYHESQPEPPRPHLGASILGHHCDRWIWLSFRWAIREQIPGRVRRLFRRGHNEEATIVSDLRAIGVNIFATEGEQTRVDFGSHVSGSVDGIIEGGVPGAEQTRHIAECKTHNKKSFDALVTDGVETAKPQHWCQMQLYMHGTGINRALYVAVCKDDDRIHTERIKYDADAAAALLERGRRLALAERIPDPITTDSTWYQCRFCPAHGFCHERQLTQEINCRTCAHTTPTADSTWSCARWDADEIPVEWQRVGCPSHVLHPDLVPWTIKDSNDPHEAVYVIDGVDVRNGEADAFTFSSRELIAGGEACACQEVGEIRRAFPGAKIKEVRNATRLSAESD